MKKTKRKAKPKIRGHWFATPYGHNSRRFASIKDLITFLKRNPGCIVSWIKGPPKS